MNSNRQLATTQMEAQFIAGPSTLLDAEQAWQQVLRRDASAKFFYAVITTGVYCRPDCKSRRPLRANVRFFSTIAEAGRAGFRPCMRCRPATSFGNSMEAVRSHLERNLDRRVPLAELARVVELSPFTVQRQFKLTMGVSPLEYQRALRAGKLRSELKNGETVTDSIYNAGFGSPSRAYEGAQLGMTPSRFAAGGRGERIAWAAVASVYGWVIAGATERGLCWLALADTKDSAESSLRAEFPAATVREDDSIEGMVQAALARVESSGEVTVPMVPLDLRGTAFQLKVWQALRAIPRGETRSYSQLARELGDPKATRAVARACATNRVALVVPCHRVVGMSGSLTGYRWGVERKRRLLEAEGSGT
jgi:AraC family transcriptional regulator, regulatory protein of adaptative response / methylated-DNA-[protein]-cysteine methyltransferase